MVVCDAVLRKLPGALGHADSVVEELFSPALGACRNTPTTPVRPTIGGGAQFMSQTEISHIYLYQNAKALTDTFYLATGTLAVP